MTFGKRINSTSSRRCFFPDFSLPSLTKYSFMVCLNIFCEHAPISDIEYGKEKGKENSWETVYVECAHSPTLSNRRSWRWPSGGFLRSPGQQHCVLLRENNHNLNALVNRDFCASGKTWDRSFVILAQCRNVRHVAVVVSIVSLPEIGHQKRNKSIANTDWDTRSWENLQIFQR